MNRSRFWLCLPPIAMFAIDISLTLCGQPEAYWSGDFSKAIEGSPEVRRVMQIHPVMLYALIVVWATVVCGLIVALPRSLSQWFALTVLIGHAIAASSWLPRHFQWNHVYQLTMALAVFTAAGWCRCHALFLLAAVEEVEQPVPRRTWYTIAVVLLIIAYCTLYPH